MICITLRDLSEKRTFDLQVNTDQKIKNTLQILQEAGMVSKEVSTATHVYSERQKQQINTGISYEQAQIYQGDIISCWHGSLPIQKGAGMQNE